MVDRATIDAPPPPLDATVNYNGVAFSVPTGFKFQDVGSAKVSVYELDIPANQGKITCAKETDWDETSVAFSSASNILRLANKWQPANLRGGPFAEVDQVQSLPLNSGGSGCQYVIQHLVIPSLGIGVAMAGQGFSSASALALARKIVASARPVATLSQA